ncbi:MAG: hypothetical protein UY70_C0017G0013 [Candidatus Kaiserbacteria bacterium GW2011_GWB1_52_6]|uniref:Uncharacterized protein n=2 Tax=Candidatus Kaiseribacteriota TaxID=1752734 RepID=A0A0G1ZST0_9BACT|nr:MAG: hypothetical protein UY70_C0017G0013 [Candidatus Kaiserbacteria bacterium GW2011_GWB1_52_6]KKW31367.1 MAG: hypothetical protein UY74_C0016G0024 [Candidatus Kaiserbacteria bacterium GW2011_GWC2_52_8b]
MKEMKQSPWAAGDELERNMDPVERARMNLEKRIASQAKKLESRVDEFEITARARDFLGMDQIRHSVDIEANQVIFCHILLKRADATLRDHYTLDSVGRLAPHEENKDGLPDLFDMVPSGTTAGDRTAMDVVKAAEALEKNYPEIHFGFTQTPEIIEYAATIRANKKDDMVS